MNKKAVRSLALIHVLGLPVAANAALEIYGTASAAVENLDNDTPTSYTEVSNTHSVFGIKGSTQISPNFKGVFKYDVFVGLDSGDSSDGSVTGGALFGGGQDSFAGVEGSFGTMALGLHSRPWKTSTDHLDFFGGTIADYSAIMGTTAGGEYFDAGIGNSVIWFTPRSANTQWHFQYGADESHDGSDDSGIQFNYTSGSMYFSVSHDVDGQAVGEDITASKVTLAFQSSTRTFAAIFENISDGDINSRSAWWVGTAEKIGNKVYKFAYARAADSDTVGPNDGATHYSVGVDYLFSPELTVYLLYSKINNDAGGSYSFISAPHTSTNTHTAVAPGADSTVMALGFRYDFSWKSEKPK